MTADGPRPQHLIAAEGGVASLVALLESANAAVQGGAAGALANLADRCAANQAAIREAGGVPPLVRLVKVGEAGWKATAVGALRNLAADCPDNQAAIVDAGAVAPLVSLLSSDGAGVQELAVATLGNLGCGCEAAQTAIGNGELCRAQPARALYSARAASRHAAPHSCRRLVPSPIDRARPARAHPGQTPAPSSRRSGRRPRRRLSPRLRFPARAGRGSARPRKPALGRGCDVVAGDGAQGETARQQCPRRRVCRCRPEAHGARRWRRAGDAGVCVRGADQPLWTKPRRA